MKKILIPLDFSDASKNVISYAMRLFPGATYDILHVRTGLFNTSEPIALAPGVTHEVFWKETLKQFIIRENGIEVFPESMNIIITYGKIVPQIIKRQKKHLYDAIVMATRDKYSPFDKWIGTVSLGVVKRAQIPIYLIPRYAKYHGFRKVLMGADYHLGDDRFIEAIVNWQKDHSQSYIKFLHIQDRVGDDFKAEQKQLVKTLFEDNDPDFAFEVEVIKDRDISQTLLAKAYNEGMDLVIVAPGKSNLITRVFLESISRDLIIKSNIPLLFLNIN